jgi:hypothetical protein
MIPNPYITDKAAHEATRNPSLLNSLLALDLRPTCRYDLGFHGIPERGIQ